MPAATYLDLLLPLPRSLNSGLKKIIIQSQRLDACNCQCLLQWGPSRIKSDFVLLLWQMWFSSVQADVEGFVSA